MATFFLCMIYAAFISLGLPDSLLGAAWPSIQASWGLPVSWAGIVTFLIAGGTVISSMASNRLIQRFGTGWVTAGSTALVTLALFGFSFAGAFCSEEISAILGADHDTIGYASDYIRILLLFSPLFLGNNLLLCFVRNDARFPFMTPALCDTTFWATSKTAITIVKQLVSR